MKKVAGGQDFLGLGPSERRGVGRGCVGGGFRIR